MIIRILVIGGTGFIGSHVLRYLLDGGHEVLVFHRGQTGISSLPSTIQHVIGDRKELPSFAAAFRQFSPQAPLDVIPYSEQDAITVIETLRGITERVMALSSQDVYRAYGLFTCLEDGSPETTPYDEEAPLRSKLYPYRALANGADELTYHYEKILVELAVMNESELPGTILRLPQVYGPSDRHHRLFDYLKRMAEANRIRTELGYEEKISREDALQSAIEWERAHLAREIDPTRFDYDAEDLALGHIARRGAGLVCKE